jgi:hypothetical protein
MTIAARVARRLVCLYPRAWRERYEAEMLALIEESGLGWARAVDLVVAAGREHVRARLGWPAEGTLTHFLMLAGSLGVTIFGIASIGTGLAMLLTHVPTPPRIWIEGGRRLIAVPLWPSRLAFFAIVVNLASTGRSLIALSAGRRVARTKNRLSAKWRLSRQEYLIWIVLAAIGAPFWQWSQRVNNLGTGVPLWPWLRIWLLSASMISTTVLLLYVQSIDAWNGAERARLREADRKTRLRASVPKDPLGLDRQG